MQNTKQHDMSFAPQENQNVMDYLTIANRQLWLDKH